MAFEDEASFYSQPTMAPVHAPAGRLQPRARLGTGANDCVRAAVAFDPVSGNSRHCLRAHFTVAEFGSFCQEVAAWLPAARRIVLVMDNWFVHRHQDTQRAIAIDPRMEVLWLPTYAPWLNPAEKIWKWVRQRRVHMHALGGNLAQLRALVDATLGRAAQAPQELLRYTGTGKYKLYGA